MAMNAHFFSLLKESDAMLFLSILFFYIVMMIVVFVW